MSCPCVFPIFTIIVTSYIRLWVFSSFGPYDTSLAVDFHLPTELNLKGNLKQKYNHLFFPCNLQAVTNLLNNNSIADIDRLRLVMLYALRYEKESPVQLMQLFNKLSSKNAKYKPGVS